MSDYKIESFEDFHRIIENYKDKSVVYRGVKSRQYELIPKVGRLRHFKKDRIEPNDERFILRLFMQQSFPLVALYFAVEDEFDGDSLVYSYRSGVFILLDRHPEPYKIQKVSKFIPNHVTSRITAQAGLFTIHPNPKDPFVSKRIDRIIVPNNLRKKIKETLYKFGIHRATLFPDLDGLAKHIEWLRTDGY